ARAHTRQRPAQRYQTPRGRQRAPPRGDRQREEVDLRGRANRARGFVDVEKGRSHLRASTAAEIVAFSNAVEYPSSTFARITICSLASFHRSCSIASRTAGSVFTP